MNFHYLCSTLHQDFSLSIKKKSYFFLPNLHDYFKCYWKSTFKQLLLRCLFFKTKQKQIFNYWSYMVSKHLCISSVQFSSIAQSCSTLCDPMNCSMPGLPVHHQLLEFTQTHVHRVSDAIQPSHPLPSPSPPAPNPSQHQSLFQWVNSSNEVAKVLEFQL